MKREVAGLVVAAALLLGCTTDAGSRATTTTTTQTVPIAVDPAARVPHVFVVMLENTGFDESFGSGSTMPYLAGNLAERGVLLTQYYGVAHHSLGNYIAQVSGQAPSPATENDCHTFDDFVQTGIGAYGQVLGDGCVYPRRVRTIADQLMDAGLSWRVYAEDMAASPKQPAACRHPELGARDTTASARVGDDYTTKHVPFVYFHSIIDSADCARQVVDLSVLGTDLATTAGTPNLAYIVPDLCNDGHDGTCADGSQGGPARADAWLRAWVPKILASPAMTAGGLLIVTFDEAEASGKHADATGCCGNLPTPNLAGQAGISGPGGGRVGAVLIGSAITPGSVTATAYNHYSLLCSLERLWGLQLLGYAGHPATPCFGTDVYTADPSFATNATG